MRGVAALAVAVTVATGQLAAQEEVLPAQPSAVVQEDPESRPIPWQTLVAPQQPFFSIEELPVRLDEEVESRLAPVWSFPAAAFPVAEGEALAFGASVVGEEGDYRAGPLAGAVGPPALLGDAEELPVSSPVTVVEDDSGYRPIPWQTITTAQQPFFSTEELPVASPPTVVEEDAGYLPPLPWIQPSLLGGSAHEELAITAAPTVVEEDPGYRASGGTVVWTSGIFSGTEELSVPAPLEEDPGSQVLPTGTVVSTRGIFSGAEELAVTAPTVVEEDPGARAVPLASTLAPNVVAEPEELPVPAGLDEDANYVTRGQAIERGGSVVVSEESLAAGAFEEETCQGSTRQPDVWVPPGRLWDWAQEFIPAPPSFVGEESSWQQTSGAQPWTALPRLGWQFEADDFPGIYTFLVVKFLDASLPGFVLADASLPGFALLDQSTTPELLDASGPATELGDQSSPGTSLTDESLP